MKSAIRRPSLKAWMTSTESGRTTEEVAATAAAAASLAASPTGMEAPGYFSEEPDDQNKKKAAQLASSFSRRIDIGTKAAAGESSRSAFPSNCVSTTKYEWWNIIPKNMWEQFHRVANVWFLVVSIFQMLPLDLSPTSKFATFVPLCCVLFVTFCKDVWEDYGRRRDDHRMNTQQCHVLGGGHRDTPAGTSQLRQLVKWKDVTVGSFLLLKGDEPIPADMVLISCSSEDGVAYVDTAQLDGETSLKPKFALEDTMRIKEAKELLDLVGHLMTEPPNQLVQSFSGLLFLQGLLNPRGVPVDAKSFLLRGSTLRNTKWVYGLVVYTGHDTKLVQNLRKTPSKRSRVEVTANFLLLIVFGVLFFAAALSAIIRAVYVKGVGHVRLQWAWPESDPLGDNNILALITFMIGYNNLIPISLYVTTDLARTLQGVRMELDSSMYHAETDSTCRVRNCALNEDLGQIEFVLTDKTGTLTENKMEFKACSIDGRIYGCWEEGHGPVEQITSAPPAHICWPLNSALQRAAAQAGQERRGSSKATSPSLSTLPQASMYGHVQDRGERVNSESSLAEGGTPAEARRKSIRRPASCHSVPCKEATEEEIEACMLNQFWVCLATCHTAIVEHLPAFISSPSTRTSLPEVMTPASSESPPLPSADTHASSSTKHGISRVLPLASSMVDVSHGAPKSGLPAQQATSGHDDADPSWQELHAEASNVTFPSSSPDDEALVAAARDHGFFLRRKVASKLVVNVRGKDRYYQVLIFNDFSSERKRMSVLVQRIDSLQDDVAGRYRTAGSAGGALSPTAEEASTMEFGATPDSTAHSGTTNVVKDTAVPRRYTAVLYAKGADNVMLERCADPHSAPVAQAKKHTKDFASKGLRTLILARRVLEPHEVEDFMRRMYEAKGAFMNREAMIEAVAESMERDMELVGVTAVEDRIQQGVPETVDMLLRAGIKVWMLTGDNMETAINIGLACRLVDVSMTQFKLDSADDGVRPEVLLKRLDEFYTTVSREVAKERKPGDFKYCLVIHGLVLYTIMGVEQVRLRQLFLALACSSCSVIACRLAPAQKAALVAMVRSSVVGNPLTLAIGDGGNDVSMIQEAHVGVGILGVEGRQAANAADFTIGQFRFLRQMLFVHGRWNLRRISIVIGYSFYKNFLLVLSLVFYAPFNGFSGTSLYESYLLTTFNLVFTSLPVLILGIFDVDVSAEMALMVPSLYQLGIQRRYFNSWTLIGWIARGCVHAAFTFATMQLVVNGWPAGPNVPDQLVMGCWAYGACVAVANVILLLHTKAWMDWGLIMLSASVILFLPALVLYSDGGFFLASTFNPLMVGVATILFKNIRSWLGLLLVTAACGLSDLALLFCRKLSAPDAADLLQEVQLGHLAGCDKLLASSWEEIPVHDVSAEECLRRLPPPPPQVFQLRPEGGVGLKPLRDPAKWGTSKADVSRRGKEIFSGKLGAVVPIAPVKEEGDVGEIMLSTECLIFYPKTYWERFMLILRDVKTSLWRWQWCEMTVTELAGGCGLNKIKASKHFKSAVRSSVSEKVGGMQEGLPGKRSSLASISTSKRIEADAGLATANGSQPASMDFGSPWERQVSDASPVVCGAASDAPTRRWSIGGVVLREGTPEEQPAHEEVVEDLIYSRVTLRFFHREQEQAFKMFLIKQAAQLFQLFIAAFVSICLMWLVYAMVKHGRDSLLAGVISLGTCLFGLTAICLLRRQSFQLNAEIYICLVVTVGIFGKHAYDISAVHAGLLVNAYFPVFIIAGLRVRFTYILYILSVHLVGFLLRYLWLPFARESFENMTVHGGHLPEEYFALMLGVMFLSVLYAYVLEQVLRKDFYVMDSIYRSKNQALEILNGMFPQEVVDHVLSKVRNKGPPKRLQEDCGIVTILFCDIYDFDGITQSLRPMELVQLLDLVWMLFDRICERHGTVKIETVGKTYMAASMPEGGASASDEVVAQGAAKAVLTAISMLGLVSQRFTGVGKLTHVDVRIGVHTGRTMSGVVGTTKPQFALFGDTVNTASRMQSTGKRGCLHASSATHVLLQDDRRFEWKGRQIEAKGKGIMDTFLLTRYNSQLEEAHGPDQAVARGPRSLTRETPPSETKAATLQEQRINSHNNSDSGGSGGLPVCGPRSSLSAAAAAAAAAHVYAELRRTSESSENDIEKQSAPPVASSDPLSGTTTEAQLAPHRQCATTTAAETTVRSLEPSLVAVGEQRKNERVNSRATSSKQSSGQPSRTSESGQERILIPLQAVAIAFHPTHVGANRAKRRSVAEITAQTTDFLTAQTTDWAKSGWTRAPHVWKRLVSRDTRFRMRNAPLFFQWCSFFAFFLCRSAVELCLLSSVTEQGDVSQREFYTIARCSVMGLGLLASALLYLFGRHVGWGDNTSSLVLDAYASVIVLVVFLGFLCSFTANNYRFSADLHVRLHSGNFWTLFESFFFVMVLVHLCRLNPRNYMPLFLCIVVVGCIIIWVAMSLKGDDKSYLLTECIGCCGFLMLMHLMETVWDPRGANFELNAICEEHAHVSELLDSMLPTEVLGEMRAGHLSLAYSYKDMTLLFADIVGFTRYCAEHTAEEAVKLVTLLFAEFDEQVRKLEIYKVCTIGDAYVAVNEPTTEMVDKHEQCQRMLVMAQYMLQTISRVRDEVNHTGLDMRIGLHVGRFAGGVIGTKRLRFDIWGEDVLVGNSVESHGRAGQIAVSQSAKQVLEEVVPSCSFEFNEEIQLKTGRVVRTYICRPVSMDEGF